ncbi:MAG: sigma-54-dependent Fis family transcriptional regulator [Alphaproteobacteria bacterium]|nr:sigma-54-dependent Fis family transcriptional regulator [Alphaproteobacteria bacterium]
MAHDILIVDDEADIRELISGILSDEDYGTRTAPDADGALREIERRRPSLMILDIWLQGSRLDGLELLDEVKANHPSLPIIVISGHGTIETAVSAIKRGAYDFIEKPFKSDRLLLQVARAIEAARLRRENEELRIRSGQSLDLIGQSGAIQAVRAAVDKVAPTNSRVLVSGPPGSGKEVVARLLHTRSRRAEGPFVVLNAASMAPERMEVELFGTEIPGDGGIRTGTFEQAHGGTLFIDEVADMPTETQGKILRVLVEQTFTRVGGQTRVSVDVRVISASSRNLQAEVLAGRFRQDLLDRLNVVPIRVPALTERREDIPLLANHFMRREAEAQGLPQRIIGDDAMAVLQMAEWPGNVRELRNIVARLLILAPGEPRTLIRADMLPPELNGSKPLLPRSDGAEEIMAMPLREARELFEREYLVAQLSRFGNNVSRTAAFVGMERSALHRKLKSLGVGSSDQPTDLN